MYPINRTRLIVATLVAALGAPLATGAPADLDSTVLAEVTVTAQKREQNVQDVGISITALSGEQLRQLGYAGTAEIIAQTPGMKMLSYSPSLTVLSIRGVSQNDFADHYEPPVAVLVDEAYVSSQGAVNTLLLDVQRVEVLRGPQGTLFGRNATGGAIQYLSNQPTRDLEARAQLTVGSFNQRNAEVVLSGPLSEKLAARLAVGYVGNDGWLKNRIGPDLNGNEDVAGRLILAYEPSETTSISLKLHGSRNDDESGGYSHRAIFADADGLGADVPADVDIYGTCPGCDLLGYRNAGSDPLRQSHDRIGFLERDIGGATAKLAFDLGFAKLTAISDYLSMDKVFGSDSDASPNNLLTFDSDQKLEQYSQEVRLSGQTDRLSWVGGIYLLDIDTHGTQSAGIGTLYDPPYVGTDRYRQTTRSAALFGQLEYQLSERFSLIGGARYTTDEKRMSIDLRDTAGSSLVFNRSLYPSLAEQTFDNVSGKIELDWRVLDDVMLYGSVNRGTKAGGFSAPIFLPFDVNALPHDQEVLTAYEAGVKSALWDGRARLNAAMFHYDYQDYQAFFLVGLSKNIANRDATINGAELELALSPVEGLDLSLGVSYLDGSVHDIVLPSGRIADRDMPMAPRWGINGLVRYRWPLFGGTLALQADATYSSAFNFYVLNPPSTEESAYTVTNTRLSFAPGDERWELAIAVKNVFDTEYRQYANDISALSIGLDAYAPPRWASLSFAYNW